MDEHSSDDRQCNQDKIKVIKDLLKEIVVTSAENGPEYNFCFFSFYLVILPEILDNIMHLAVSFPQKTVLNLTWGYLDTAFVAVLGAHQLLTKSHTPIENNAKGMTNIAASVQAVTLVSIGLGPIGYAAMLGLGFVHSLYDLGKRSRMLIDAEYRKKNIQEEYSFIKDKLEQIQKEIDGLQEQLSSLGNNISSKEQAANAEHLKKMQWWVQEIFNIKKAKKERYSDRLNILAKATTDHNNQGYIDNLLQERKECICNSVLWGLAFIGVLLACIPGMQIPALIVISIVVGLYICKHFDTLKSVVKTAGMVAVDSAHQLNAKLSDFFHNLHKNANPSSEKNQDEDIDDSGESMHT